MKKVDLALKISQLERDNDNMLNELADLDHLMRAVGFTEGIATVKMTAQELYKQDQEQKGAKGKKNDKSS